MAQQPRTIYATKGGTAIRVHVPRRFLPIIVVPDLMGTRLVDPKVGQPGQGSLVFNPTGKPFGRSPRAVAVKYKRLSLPAELDPAEGHGSRSRSARNRVAHIRHYNNLVTDTYGDLLTRLGELGDGDDFDQLGIRPVVYCAGYDWRQDNARSALRLAGVVEEALRETGASRCVIVAHGMGGLVARYYCRALGGEARVHQLYLIGSPVTGVPGAYVQLKHGVHGAYVNDLIEAAAEGDVQGAVREGVDLAAQIARGIGGRSLIESLGSTYFALCLGAGKLLRREETAYFARQLPSLYQLMPNRIFCDDHKHWVVFDPLITGQPPTGHMVVFPSLLDATMLGIGAIVEAVEGEASTAGDDAKEAYEKALALGRHERTSPRASRNVTTLDDLIDTLVEGGQAMGDDDWSQAGDMVEAIVSMYERVDHAFVNCQSPRHLYSDIYTGLMDNVAQRPLVAGSLALAERFDRALSVGKDKDKESALSIFDAILNPIKAAIGERRARRRREREDEDESEQQEAPTAPEVTLKAYVHPRTTCVYANHLQVDAGCLLLPTDVVSNDDSNEVQYELLPFPVGFQGDGTVPADSAHPAEAKLSHPFEAEQAVPGASHSRLPGFRATTTFLERRINLGLEDWLEGEQ